MSTVSINDINANINIKSHHLHHVQDSSGGKENHHNQANSNTQAFFLPIEHELNELNESRYIYLSMKQKTTCFRS